jgi:hypothetical protein
VGKIVVVGADVDVVVGALDGGAAVVGAFPLATGVLDVPDART